MMNRTEPDIRIREINPNSKKEISLVASWMQQTLVEILGAEQAYSLYSLDWLAKQAEWHANPEHPFTKIFFVENKSGDIVAYAMARVKKDRDLSPYGCFSLVFVEPRSRNKGLASLLIAHAEAWLRKMKISKIICNTQYNHLKMIHLLERHGFIVTQRQLELLQLTKYLN